MRLRLAGHRPLVGRDCRTDMWDETHPERLIIDASDLEFATPLELAGIVATAHQALAAGAQVSLVPPAREEVAAYLQRMDVVRRLPPTVELAGGFPSERRVELVGRLLEVQRMSADTVDDLTQELGRMLTSHFDNRVGKRYFRSIGELLDNAVDHGTSQTGAFVAAQTYTGRTTGAAAFEVAICDTGVGVREHLRKNPKNKVDTDADALRKAIREHVSGTNEDRGFGLHDVIEARQMSGVYELRLSSGDGHLLASGTSAGHEVEEREGAPHVRGTWAWFRVEVT